jgi:multidrug efflux pump subunit AcrA (membrane-fusion protein)
MDPNNPTGGDPTQGGGAPPSNPPAPGSQSGASDKTFTQADVDRINAETRRKAEEAAQRRFLEQLGVDDVDKAKEIIAQQRASEDAAKTELQKAQEAREAAERTATEATAKAESILKLSELKSALRDAGINPGRIEGAVKLADLGSVTVTDTGVAGIEKVVEAVKAASPEWFGAAGKPFSAPDASGGGEPKFDYRTASPEERSRRLRELNVKPVSHGVSY